jgi:glucosamine--fructose-6-phosphate aminotransferase (isomerizing)
MMNILWNDILAQPANLANVVGHLYGAERARLEAAAYFMQNDRPIAFIGVASAAYLCYPAASTLCEHGRFATVIDAADALYTHLPALKDANVIVNTRSGETAEIVKLGEALQANNIPFVAITNEPQSTLAKIARHVIGSNTRKDDLVSINVVTGMMTTTLALAAAISGELELSRAAFEALPAQMDAVLSESVQRGREFQQIFKHIRPIHLLYRGALKGAAYNGRLVLEEIARTPAVPVEAAEFRQGPNEVVDERFGAVVFVPGGRPGALNRSLVKDIRRSGGTVLAVGEVEDYFSLSIRSVPDELLSLLAVVPVQVLAYQLAEGQGYTPGTTRYITKVIVAEEGIPNQ